MAKSSANAHAWGDLASGVWVDSDGTLAVPTTLAAPITGYNEVGWISEDGVTEAKDIDSETFPAWQGGTIIRKKVTSVDQTRTFQALETNLITVGLFYRKPAVTVASGVARIPITNQSKSDIRRWIFDYVDGTVTERHAIPQGEVTEFGEIARTNTGLSVFEMTVSIYGDYEIISNAPALIA